MKQKRNTRLVRATSNTRLVRKRPPWRMQRAMPEMELLGRLAKGSRKVACIGGFGGFGVFKEVRHEGDPVPAFLTQNIGGRGRKVILVDNQDNFILDELRRRKRELADVGRKIPKDLAAKIGYLQSSMRFGHG